MRIIPLASQAIGKMTLVSLLLSPFAVTPGYAAELVGRPVNVGAHAESHSTSNHTEQQADKIGVAAQASSAATLPEPSSAPAVQEEPQARQELHNTMEELRNNFQSESHSGFDSFHISPDIMIPVVAMLLLFGGPVLLVIILAILHYRSKARRQRNLNANIDKLLAAGRDIPLELLLGEEPAVVKRSVSGETTVYHNEDANMHKGIRNIGLGTGWLIFLTIMFGIKIGAFGFIFIGLGISQVVIWKLSGAQSRPQVDVNRVQE